MPTKQQTVPSVKTLMDGIQTPDGFEREETTGSWDYGENAKTFPVLRLDSPDTRIEIHFTAADRPESYLLGSGHVTFDTPMGERTFDRHGVEDSFYIDNPLKDYELRFWSGDRIKHGTKEGVFGTVVDQGMERGERVRPIKVLWDHTDEPVEYSERQLKRTIRATRTDVIDRTNHTIRKIIEERIPEVRERLAKSERVPGLPFTVTLEQKAQITETLKQGGYHRFTPSGFGTGYALFSSAHRRTPSAWVSNADLARFFNVRAVYVETFDAD